MNIKHLFLIAFITLLGSCKQDSHLYKIEGKQVPISDSLESKAEIDSYIKPYRENLEKNMSTVLAYSVDTYSKRDGELNTAIGNLMADAVYEESNPIFNKRTGKNIDFVLLNHGGIRSIMSKGDVITRTAYELMPFDNSVVVVELRSAQVKELIEYLARAKRAHPISRLKIVLDKDYGINSAFVNNKPLDNTKIYNVATNDYLYNGGDHMDFFKTNDSLHVLNYKIRNVLLDYFEKKDTLNPVIDDRFIQIKN
ncbi:hypothetical protein A9Q87_00760 [Flavobacteriales bacterium 34_180_T64]|nr:hypothetical protein A9Q87_00760 [Flavobacteriales bacterium 34_180_T64]